MFPVVPLITKACETPLLTLTILHVALYMGSGRCSYIERTGNPDAWTKVIHFKGSLSGLKLKAIEQIQVTIV